MNCPYPVRVCTKCKRILIAHEINFRRNSKKNNKFRASCIKCEKEYYENNKDNIKIYQKQYREDNKEHISESKKIWNKNNPDKLFNSHCKRRMKEDKGDGFTKNQWFEMMEFFNWECAYSGERFTKDNKNRTIDHIVALDNGGEHEIWNLVPMYKNYNSSKKNNNMLEWYLKQEYFDINRLTKIYEWRIYAYWKYKK